ncbi:L-lactate permease [Desulfitobacterium hafniense DCB-2]|uniref:L-lactate permease n=1 Tax=Desulfitobacterium hafniense (strain DSM 10664 / DCB-2) TaxID=272564 RepID=B8G0R7_DESHD|nr:L-lactate permease [Desulfitobacterium hafniense]ACL18336.1 L-lactate permease [Desulfitobacterium hafniense DCB-2]
MEIILAAMPFLIILVLLFILRQSAVRAGISAYLLTLLIGLVIPRFQIERQEILHATVKAVLTSAIVAYVLLFGIFLYHIMNETGLIKRIASLISGSTQDPVRQVILLVVAFSPLVESVSGYGIAIIVVAPILVELGFSRFKAVLLSLLGLSAVPWGALATGTYIGANLAGIPFQRLGTDVAVLSIPTFFYFAVTAVYLAGGWQGVRAKWAELMLVAGSLAFSVWLFNAYVSIELAGVFASLVALGVEFAFIYFTAKSTPEEAAFSLAARNQSKADILKTMSPYLILTGVLFISRLVPPIKAFAGSHAVFSLPAYSFSLPVLYSPGFSIFLTCLLTILLFKIQKHVIKRAVQLSLKQWLPVTLSTIAFIGTSEIMAAAGMTTTLAQAAAAAFGSAFVLCSPLIGGFGGFLTGSNVASNAMLINLQVEVAKQIGVPPELFASMQNTSSSHMTMASPSRVLLGASVCNIRSEENRLLQKIFPMAMGSLVLVLAAVFILRLL